MHNAIAIVLSCSLKLHYYYNNGLIANMATRSSHVRNKSVVVVSLLDTEGL